MKKILNICLIISLLLVQAVSAENFKLIIEDELRFRLVPEKTLNNIVTDLKSADHLKLELSTLKNINNTNDEIIFSQKRIIKDLELKNEIWSKEIEIRKGYTNQLELLYDFEIKENERLRLDEPNVIIWSIGGFVVGISVIYLASMILENSR